MPALRDWLTARPIAHRGLHDCNHLVWENTLSAFDAAIEGNFAIECDVRLTLDGVPVLFHDDQLKRLTGREGLVHETRAEDLQAMTVGATADRVPTLDTMLARVAGRVPLVEVRRSRASRTRCVAARRLRAEGMISSSTGGWTTSGLSTAVLITQN